MFLDNVFSLGWMERQKNRGAGQRIQETNGATEKKRKETKLLIEGLRTAET